MKKCSVCKCLQIEAGCLDDYNRLASYHYRDGRLGAFTKIFAIKPGPISARRIGAKTVGVIVYTMPIPGLELRGVATDNYFSGFDRSTRLALINRHIRCIGRVIIEPRFRGLGLASRLVRETMPKINVPIIEAMAVMGLVNPFFEKAGMKAFTATIPARCVRLVEALNLIGLAGRDLIDPDKARQKLDSLPQNRAEFIEREIRRFLQSYGSRRDMPACPERTRFVLSKLTARPVYYIWFNPDKSIGA